MTSMSMEEFGPVSLDYFAGRIVESVTEGGGGDGDPIWVVKLEGGGEIRNYDPSLGQPNVEGMAVTLVTLSATKGTQVWFGTDANPRSVMVNFNPMEYSIFDPNYTKGVEVFAQRSHANMPPAMAPHPDERVQEGPEEPGGQGIE